MSTSRVLLERFLKEGWSAGNVAALDELLAPTFVDHTPFPGLSADREGIKQSVLMVHGGFPDIQFEIEDLIVEENKAAARWTGRGTHRGEIMGIPPTGKSITYTGMTIAHVSGGRITDNWGQLDMLGLLQQLGVIPNS